MDEKEKIGEKEFNPHDADEMYDDILKGVEYGKINKILERLATVISYAYQTGLLLILFSSSYVIYKNYSFGVALMFFVVPIILNKNKFKRMKFVWKMLSYIAFALSVIYGLFLSFGRETKSYFVILTIISVLVLMLILYSLLIAFMIKQDRLVKKAPLKSEGE